MNVGVGQTGKTCWFFSSLNLFLMSDNGLKILWQKLKEEYAKMSLRNKSYFNSNISASCPIGRNPLKMSKVYFWKFLNQYVCAVGGPGKLLPKSGLNAYLTKNIPWKSASVREAKGTIGAWPASELPVILKHIGFKQGGRGGGDFRIIDFDRWIYRFKRPEWNEPILIYRRENNKNATRVPLRNLIHVKQGYTLTAATIYVSSFNQNSGGRHVWSCVIRNDKGYIIDPNYPTISSQCDWWSKDAVLNYFSTSSHIQNNYRPDKAYIAFELVMYTRNEFTNKIHPSCEMPKEGYRQLTENNLNQLITLEQANRYNAGILKKLRAGNTGVRGLYSPLVLATALRRNAARPVVTSTMLNNIVRASKSFNNGIRIAENLSQNHKLNKQGQNYLNFKRKLIAKFPRAMPKNKIDFILSNSKTRNEATRRINAYSLYLGYTVPSNLQSILNRRESTRAGTKRKLNANAERRYKVISGNNTYWYNNNGNNVHVNPDNWVQVNNSRNAATALLNLKEFPRNSTVTVYKRK